MAYHNNPRIITNGLSLYQDPVSPKSFNTDLNILNAKTWTVGTTGTQTGFTKYGSDTENYIVLDQDPFGNEAVIWEARPDGTSADTDGGWNTSTRAIDNTKMYRCSVWVKRNKSGNGNFYLGAYGYGTTNGLLYRSNNSNNTNPYFYISSNPAAALDTWVLIVAHIWPTGAGSGAEHVDSGRYTVASGRIGSITVDLVFRPETTTSIIHRSYLYNCTDSTVRQQWAYPRVDIVDGTEPSINDLLSNSPNSLYLKDLTSNTNGTLINGVTKSNSNNGCMIFDGVDQYIQLNSTVTMLSSGYSISAWINIDDFTTAKTSKGRSFIRNSTTTTTSMIAFYNGGFSFETLTNSSPHELSGLTTSGNITDSNITSGNWFYFTLVFDADVFYSYVNGVFKTSGALVNNLSFNRIGDATGFSTGYPEYFKGKISNFKVYSRALRAEEVLKNYKVYKSRFN